jgi:hypothetical protein
MNAGIDISLLRNFSDVSHQERYEEERHEHSLKEPFSVERIDHCSFQTEDSDASFERLSSKDGDGESVLTSPSSSSLLSYAGEWSTLDQRFAGLKPTPELPDAGAEVSPSTNFTAESQIGDVGRFDQDVALLFAILSRNACARDISRMINSSPAPTDAAPTNRASANGKAPDSSKKRSNHSKPKPKSRANNEEVDSESDSDDRHRTIRPKTAHGPLVEVEQRAFACPFYKLYPQRHRRMCGEIHYPANTSGVYSVQVRA